MFNNSPINSSNHNSNGGNIIKSGYNPQNQMQHFGQIKRQFAQALNIQDSDLTDAAIEQSARREGEARSIAEKLRKASKWKLKEATAINNIHNAVWQHTQGAMAQELQWRNTAARNLEQASGKMLDLDIATTNHAGFAQYSDTADKIINY